MNNIHSSIDSPHPDLQVDEKANELAPYLPASNNGTLLYQGPVVGRWPNAEIAYSHAPGLSDEERHARAASFSTGIDGSGDVRFKLSPDPHISWWFCTHDWSVGGSWPVLVPPERPASGFATYDGVRGVVPLRLDRYTTGGGSRVMLPARIGDRNGRLDEVKFYLVNFQVWHLVDDVYHKEQLERKARLSLRADVWRIDIERRLDFPQALNHLEEQRGYAVTHNCRLWKETDDGERQQFTFEEAEPLLEATRLFASFVRGGMVGLALPVGYRDGTSVFEEWHVTPADPGRYRDPNGPRPFPGWYVWFDHPEHPSANPGAAKWLPPLFDQFAAKWWHPDPQAQRFWRNVFRELIYTYTDAERTDQSRAIVPAGTALETLGWATLVVMERWLTEDRQPDGGMGGYDRLTASDRMRLLLRWAGLITEIPEALSKLRQKAVSSNWDGPQVVTWVRNRVVHPDRRDQLVDGIAAEAWLMAMWYTELAILKLLGYDGYYRDRLDDGRIKRVPWVAE